MGKRSLIVLAVVLIGVALWRLALDEELAPDEKADSTSSVAPVAPEPATREPGPVAQKALELAAPESAQERPAAPPTSATPTPTQAPEEGNEPPRIPVPTATGPIASLKHAFESEPRDSAAHAPEARIEGEFKKSDIDPGLLKSAQCRESVCRVEVNWSPARAQSFMAAFTRLSADFEPDIAFDPQATSEGKQETQVDVYLPRRREGTEAKPAQP